MYNLYFLAHNFCLWIVPADKINNAVNDFIYMLAFVADTTYTQSRHLPEVMVIYFSYRDIVLIPKFGDKGLKYLSLVFKRLISWYM